MAVELMRQCWKAHPHTPGEMVQLASLHGLSRLTPSVALLVEELAASARELSFLHHPPTRHSSPATRPWQPNTFCAIKQDACAGAAG